MSEKKTNDVRKKVTSFSYRNIKKDLSVPYVYPTLSEQFHLEVGEHNQAVVVPDRPTDWEELQNTNVDKVGLQNVLLLAQKRGDSLAAFSFQDDEALDLSEINPMNPNAVKDVVASQKEASAKLDGIAQQLGVSTDTLVKAFMDGSFADLVASKIPTEKVEEGDK